MWVNQMAVQAVFIILPCADCEQYGRYAIVSAFGHLRVVANRHQTRQARPPC